MRQGDQSMHERIKEHDRGTYQAYYLLVSIHVWVNKLTNVTCGLFNEHFNDIPGMAAFTMGCKMKRPLSFTVFGSTVTASLQQNKQYQLTLTLTYHNILHLPATCTLILASLASILNVEKSTNFAFFFFLTSFVQDYSLLLAFKLATRFLKLI